ncbi:AraC family transcriptional regulator [Thalassobacillus devorans]|nr:AraC family transcriptional regulator [Thalassobacillus devorans]
MLEEVAAHVDLSPYYLSKLFKEKKGVTFIEYLTGIRVIHNTRMFFIF